MVYEKVMEARVIYIVALTEVFGVLGSIFAGVLRHACCF